MNLIYAGIIACFSLMSCNSEAPPTYNDPLPKYDSFQIQSVPLQEERKINVWTPDNYNNTSDSFIVLYMADGGTQEDFPHIANTLASLIAAKKIPPIILVGIENTNRRRDLSGPSSVKEDEKVAPLSDGAAQFRAFINDELFSAIQSKYRTKVQKGIIGESLSGLFVMETFLLKPEMFDYYIAMDPSFWWNNGFLVKNAPTILSKHNDEQPKKLWFAGSNAKDISKYTKEFSKTLEATKQPNLTWQYSDEPKEKHNTIFRATKEKALIWTFGM